MRLRAALFAFVVAPLAAAAQAPLPKTGADYSAIDEFYRMAALLSSGAEPTEAQWKTLLATPGYRLVQVDNPGIRARIELAFKPSLAARRDSVLKTNGDLAGIVEHLRRTVTERDAIVAMRAKLERTLHDSIAVALARTAKFLPKGTIDRMPVPLIGFAPFADDGYSMEEGVLCDPLEVKENGIVELLAHELHHSYGGAITRTLTRPEIMAMKTVPPYVPVYATILHLRNEGMADQIDKPYPFVAKDTVYAKRYNAAYARTPVVLRAFDSLLVALPANPRLAGRASGLFYSNGHPNGAYMGRTIVETFGVDSLLPAATNPFAFLWAYASAEAKRGNPPPFSPQATALLREMEKVYLKP